MPNPRECRRGKQTRRRRPPLPSLSAGLPMTGRSALVGPCVRCSRDCASPRPSPAPCGICRCARVQDHSPQIRSAARRRWSSALSPQYSCARFVSPNEQRCSHNRFRRRKKLTCWQHRRLARQPLSRAVSSNAPSRARQSKTTLIRATPSRTASAASQILTDAANITLAICRRCTLWGQGLSGHMRAHSKWARS